MKDDPARTRFWMWMNGFIGSMLLLVLSSNLFFLFNRLEAGRGV